MSDLSLTGSPSQQQQQQQQPRATVKENEVHSLHQKLTYGEDAIDGHGFHSEMNSPNYNMRTWAASTRKAHLTGGGPSGSSGQSGYSGSIGGGTAGTGNSLSEAEQKRAAKMKSKMAKWDTSHVQEVEEERSFLNNGPSAVLLTRKPPVMGLKEKSSTQKSLVSGRASTPMMLSQSVAGNLLLPATSPASPLRPPSGGGIGETADESSPLLSATGNGQSHMTMQSPLPSSSSTRMHRIISRFKPKAEGNNEVLKELNQSAEDYVARHCHAKLPFGSVPSSAGKNFLEEQSQLQRFSSESFLSGSGQGGSDRDIRLLGRQTMSSTENIGRHNTSSYSNSSLLLSGSYAPRRSAASYHKAAQLATSPPAVSRATTPSGALQQHHSSSVLPPVASVPRAATPTDQLAGTTRSAQGAVGEGSFNQTSLQQPLNPATAPVHQLLNLGLAGGILPIKESEATVDVDLPVHQDVNYTELLREQAIIERDCKEHDQIYKGLVEDLDIHMASVKNTFQAMLGGKFELKEEDKVNEKKRQKQSKADAGVLPTNENFGSGGKNVAFILPSSPAFSRGSAVQF